MSILTPGGSAKKSVEGWQCCVYTPTHLTYKGKIKKNLGGGGNKKPHAIKHRVSLLDTSLSHYFEGFV